MFYLIIPYLIRCVCEVGIMEEFQVYHANGERYVECNFLRIIVGNVDTFTPDTSTCRTLQKELLLVGVDTIFLHGYMDMDVVLCSGHEVVVRR